MRKLFILGMIALWFAIVGCMSSPPKYTQPNHYDHYDTSVVINKSMDNIWKTLVVNLGTSFFVINNMEKDSGFINLSYSGDPCNYIDCGFINSKFKNLSGDQSANFPACKSSQQYVVSDGFNTAWLNRTMSLEGRINLTVIELDPNKTRVNVNVKYIVTRTYSGDTSGGKYVHGKNSCSFGSNGVGVIPGSKGTTCKANGNLEKEILNLIQ